MTDPWDERYIYLLIYNKNQLNVGTVNIPYVDAMGLAAVFVFFTACRELEGALVPK